MTAAALDRASGRRSARASALGRGGNGWVYILADLALILFMVTAAALASADEPAPKPQTVAGGQPLSPQAEPLALYRAAPGAPPLGQWLRDQSADPRQQLTIVAQYRPGQQAAALDQASAMADDAGEAGLHARIVIEPGEGGITAALAFDNPSAPKSPEIVARRLQETVPGT